MKISIVICMKRSVFWYISTLKIYLRKMAGLNFSGVHFLHQWRKFIWKISNGSKGTLFLHLTAQFFPFAVIRKYEFSPTDEK